MAGSIDSIEAFGSRLASTLAMDDARRMQGGVLTRADREGCPHLYAMVVDKNLDAEGRERIAQMVGLATRVHRGEVKEHDASVQVGESLADRYVRPLIDESS